MTLNEMLAEIERRTNAATIGPWVVSQDDPTVVLRPKWVWAGHETLCDVTPRPGDPTPAQRQQRADAAFMAAARADVPRLVAALRYAIDEWLGEFQSEWGPPAADKEREKITAILRGEAPPS